MDRTLTGTMMMPEEGDMRNNEYFHFLCDLVWEEDPNILESQRTEKIENILLHELFKMEFVPLIPNDDNRCADGQDIREDYLDNGGGQHGLPLCYCTVLEMLIALSFRLEFETSQSKWEKSPCKWFWILIDNLGLNFNENKDLTKQEYLDKIHHSVTLFVNRGYKSNGEGGLFPLKNPKKDQKKVEIWYQMSAYILENYPI